MLNFTESLFQVQISDMLKFIDSRGSLRKIVPNTEFLSKEVFITENNLGTFRGMHLQWGSHPAAKRITILQGRASQLLFDCRSESPTYKKYMRVELSGDSPVTVEIPVGVAQGYLSLEHGTKIHYQMNADFCKSCDSGFINETIVSYFQNMTHHSLIMSDRDLNLSELSIPNWHEL